MLWMLSKMTNKQNQYAGNRYYFYSLQLTFLVLWLLSSETAVKSAANIDFAMELRI